MRTMMSFSKNVCLDSNSSFCSAMWVCSFSKDTLSNTLSLLSFASSQLGSWHFGVYTLSGAIGVFVTPPTWLM